MQITITIYPFLICVFHLDFYLCCSIWAHLLFCLVFCVAVAAQGKMTLWVYDCGVTTVRLLEIGCECDYASVGTGFDNCQSKPVVSPSP